MQRGGVQTKEGGSFAEEGRQKEGGTHFKGKLNNICMVYIIVDYGIVKC